MFFIALIISLSLALYAGTLLFDLKKSGSNSAITSDSGVISNKVDDIGKIDNVPVINLHNRRYKFSDFPSDRISAHTSNRLPNVILEDRFQFEKKVKN